MTAAASAPVVIEVVGEGITDVGPVLANSSLPTAGVVTVLVHRLCDEPPNMLVLARHHAFLQAKGRWQKVKFAKQRAKLNGSAACVYVLDSEGDLPDARNVLRMGRESICHDFPMAIGVAHPCTEAWLLADPSAIKRGLGLNQRPPVPQEPEALPAPRHDRANNPKTAIAACNTNSREPTAAEKTDIAGHLGIDVVEAVCPSFAAFATEVRHRILPLFLPPAATAPVVADPPVDPQP